MKKEGCKFCLIVQGRNKPLCFNKKVERDKVAKYLKGIITYSTFSKIKKGR